VAIQAWPSALPAPSFEFDSQLRAGQSDADDQINLYRTRTYPERDASFSLDLSAAEFAAFRSWFESTLNGGCAMFTADWLEAAGFDHHMLRFRDNPWSAKRSGIRWTVTLNLEIVSLVPMAGGTILYWIRPDTLVISGESGITLTDVSGIASQYTATGGVAPYTWGISGTGASIDENGLATFTAVGTVTVVVWDAAETEGSFTVVVSATELSISGDSEIAAGGTEQYSASGGLPPYSWSVSGAGASIDSSGLLTVTGDFGSWTVTVEDFSGQSATLIAAKYVAEKAVLPNARRRHTGFALDGLFYVVGGDNLNSTGVLYNYNSAYNPDTDTWSSKTVEPTARQGSASAVYGGVSYCMTGATASAHSSKNEAYTASTNAWATKTVVPTVRWGPRAAEVNGIIYCMGGQYNSTTTLNKNEAYTVSTNTWATKTVVPTGVKAPIVLSYNSLVYLIGGQTYSNSYSYQNVAYDPSTNTWSTKTSTPYSSYVGAGAVIDDKLFRIGGWTESGVGDTTSVVAYDPATDTWTTYPNITEGFADMSCGLIGGVIYFTGYRVSDSSLIQVRAYKPVL
jgi:N-acetylneuraminic acid mutarotase